MQTKAVRIYGKEDLRLDTIDLPEIRENEILVKVITDSACMSTYKFLKAGPENKRSHPDMEHNPCVVGHEFCGEILEVGADWKDQYAAGEIVIVQPALNELGIRDSAGYTFPYCGGNTEYAIIAHEFIDTGHLIKCNFPAYYLGSLTEPLSCISRAFHAFLHSTPGFYEYTNGNKAGGNMAILAGAGPMGLGAIDYALHNEFAVPGLLVVTDVSEERLTRARNLFAGKNGTTRLEFVNTGAMEDPVAGLMELTGQEGFDDVLVMAPVAPLIEQGDAILSFDGCLSFFAGPTDPQLKASINFFNVHYAAHHIIGTMGGTDQDMIECADLMARGKLDPSCMVTHIGGLNAVIDTLMNFPKIPGAKKLFYNHLDLPLTALDELKDSEDERLRKLGELVEKNHGLWGKECEDYLLEVF